MPPPRLVPALLLAALIGLPVLAGCGAGEPASSPPPAPPTAEPSAPASPASPTASDSVPPSESPSSPPSALPAPRMLLLPANDLPGFNDEWSWSEQRTGPEKAPTGVCQRLPLSTIGADRSVVRSYVPTGDLTGGTATHLVGRFVDETSAAQALAVLRSWHDRCADRLSSYPFKRIGAVVPVDTAQGTAFRYLVSYRPDGRSGRFDEIGVLRSGSTVEVLLLRLVGQDYNYPPGADPMATALERAASRLP